MPDVRVIEGDCLAVLPTLEDGSVDAVITDPPYPCIKRDYGVWTEAEWFALINPVVEQCRRVLKPTGSAVFILQPNSERVGRMRTWLWEFMAKWGREWGMVQDVWWWNHAALPLTKNDPHRLRGSLKACVWLGAPGCYRNADAVLWSESDATAAIKLNDRAMRRVERKTDTRVNVVAERTYSASTRRGGTQPYNVLPFGPTRLAGSKHGHGAATPVQLLRWWARYICPPGGTVLDPFAGSGTTGIAALREGRGAVLIERHPPYCDIIRRRLAEESGPLFTQEAV